MESPYRWSILAGIFFACGLVGAIVFMTYAWSLAFAKFWFYLGLLATLYCLSRIFVKWKAEQKEAGSDRDPGRGHAPPNR